jgi:hypothetical protein
MHYISFNAATYRRGHKASEGQESVTDISGHHVYPAASKITITDIIPPKCVHLLTLHDSQCFSGRLLVRRRQKTNILFSEYFSLEFTG